MSMYHWSSLHCTHLAILSYCHYTIVITTHYQYHYHYCHHLTIPSRVPFNITTRCTGKDQQHRQHEQQHHRHGTITDVPLARPTAGHVPTATLATTSPQQVQAGGIITGSRQAGSRRQASTSRMASPTVRGIPPCTTYIRYHRITTTGNNNNCNSTYHQVM